MPHVPGLLLSEVVSRWQFIARLLPLTLLPPQGARHRSAMPGAAYGTPLLP
jgi:hypothetical protein